jgi:thiaminase
MDHNIEELVEHAQQEIRKQVVDNRYIRLLEAGDVPVQRLDRLAGELYRLVGSDRRSFALLASRYPSPPAGTLFLSMAGGEAEAMQLLMDFSSAVGMGEQELQAYEPQPLAQAYPAYLAQTALFGTSSAVALALLANVEESGGYYARVAAALRSRYGLLEEAVAHFLFLAETPQSLLDQAASTIAVGLSNGEDPAEAVRAARMVNAYEAAFWDTLAEGISKN